MVPVGSISGTNPEITIRCGVFSTGFVYDRRVMGTFSRRSVSEPFLNIEEHDEHGDHDTYVKKYEHLLTLQCHFIILHGDRKYTICPFMSSCVCYFYKSPHFLSDSSQNIFSHSPGCAESQREAAKSQRVISYCLYRDGQFLIVHMVQYS